MPRLSEKSLELTICAQMGHYAGRLMFWFGLTQSEEARWGYDARTRIGGRLCVFQFKASNYVTRTGDRKFKAPHDQMVQLRRLCGNRRGWVFYVLPLIGNTDEIVGMPDIIAQSWLLDVADIPDPVPDPLTRTGTIRASGEHYIYARPGFARIHSEPFDVPLYSAAKILADKQQTGLPDTEKGFWQHLTLKQEVFPKRTYGVIIT